MLKKNVNICTKANSKQLLYYILKQLLYYMIYYINNYK